MKTIDAAAGKWPMILRAFGLDQSCMQGGTRHHKCPAGNGGEKFRLSDRNGSGSFFCNCSMDGKGGGFKLLECMTGRKFADLAKEVDDLIGNTPDRIAKPDAKDPLPALRAIERKSTKPAHHVTSYLEGRGLITPPTLRELEAIDYWNCGEIIGKFAAMAGKIVDVDCKPRSWHITYLQDGMKAPVDPARKVMPPDGNIRGCAIRLFPAAEHIGIAEGIETAIAAHMMFALPVWSCVSRGGVESFEPPAGVKAVTIYGDNDASFAGQAGAYKAAESLARKRIRVDVRLPETIGDWADVWMSKRS